MTTVCINTEKRGRLAWKKEPMKLTGVSDRSENAASLLVSRKRKTMGYEAAGGCPVPLIDQVHRLIHLWKAGDVVKVDQYLDDKGLRRNALFHQLLQALIELAPAGSDERALLESISNHVAARGKESAERQLGLFNINSEEL